MSAETAERGEGIAVVRDTTDDLPFDPDAFDFELEEFPMDDASVSDRSGDKAYPYIGASVWLAPFPAPSALIEGGASLAGADAARAVALPMLRHGISECVAGHTLRNPRTGDYYPQFWRQPDALSDLPAETLFDLVSIIQNGELSETRKNASSGGRAGTSTRQSTGRKTGPTPTARVRR